MNAERLAAYNRGELGPEDVLKSDTANPIADKSSEGPTTAEEAVLAGGAGATAAAVAAGEHERPRESTDEHEGKKPSLIQKILHPNKSRREEKERRASQEASRASQDSGTRHMGTDGPIGDDHRVSGLDSSSADASQARHMGTDGPIGNDNKVSGLDSSSSAAKDTPSTSRASEDVIQPAASSNEATAHLLAKDEKAPEGYITITHPNAHPDAPHLVVTDK